MAKPASCASAAAAAVRWRAGGPRPAGVAGVDWVGGERREAERSESGVAYATVQAAACAAPALVPTPPRCVLRSSCRPSATIVDVGMRLGGVWEGCGGSGEGCGGSGEGEEGGVRGSIGAEGDIGCRPDGWTEPGVGVGEGSEGGSDGDDGDEETSRSSWAHGWHADAGAAAEAPS